MQAVAIPIPIPSHPRPSPDPTPATAVGSPAFPFSPIKPCHPFSAAPPSPIHSFSSHRPFASAAVGSDDDEERGPDTDEIELNFSRRSSLSGVSSMSNSVGESFDDVEQDELELDDDDDDDGVYEDHHHHDLDHDRRLYLDPPRPPARHTRHLGPGRTHASRPHPLPAPVQGRPKSHTVVGGHGAYPASLRDTHPHLFSPRSNASLYAASSDAAVSADHSFAGGYAMERPSKHKLDSRSCSRSGSASGPGPGSHSGSGLRRRSLADALHFPFFRDHYHHAGLPFFASSSSLSSTSAGTGSLSSTAFVVSDGQPVGVVPSSSSSSSSSHNVSGAQPGNGAGAGPVVSLSFSRSKSFSTAPAPAQPPLSPTLLSTPRSPPSPPTARPRGRLLTSCEPDLDFLPADHQPVIVPFTDPFSVTVATARAGKAAPGSSKKKKMKKDTLSVVVPPSGFSSDMPGGGLRDSQAPLPSGLVAAAAQVPTEFDVSLSRRSSGYVQGRGGVTTGTGAAAGDGGEGGDPVDVRVGQSEGRPGGQGGEGEVDVDNDDDDAESVAKVTISLLSPRLKLARLPRRMLRSELWRVAGEVVARSSPSALSSSTVVAAAASAAPRGAARGAGLGSEDESSRGDDGCGVGGGGDERDEWWPSTAVPQATPDTFFSLSANDLEVSIVAEESIIERDWRPVVEKQRRERERKERERRRRRRRRRRSRRGRRKTGTAEAEAEVQVPAPKDVSGFGFGVGENEVKISEDVWCALAVACHGDGIEDAGNRVREISSPLAKAGISILFLSTYVSDFILVKRACLPDVFHILHRSGYVESPGVPSAPAPAPAPPAPPHLCPPSPELNATTTSSRRNSFSPTRSSPTVADYARPEGEQQPEQPESSISSLVLSETETRGGASSATSSLPAVGVGRTLSLSALPLVHSHSPSPQPNPTGTGAVSSPHPSALAHQHELQHEQQRQQQQRRRGSWPVWNASMSRDSSLAGALGAEHISILPDSLVTVGLSRDASEALVGMRVLQILAYSGRKTPQPGVSALRSGRRGRATGPARKACAANDGLPLSSATFSPSATAAEEEPAASSSSPSVEDLESSESSDGNGESSSSSPSSEEDDDDDDDDDDYYYDDSDRGREGEPDAWTFFSLTRTDDGTSITTDHRALRAVFGGGGDEDLILWGGDGRSLDELEEEVEVDVDEEEEESDDDVLRGRATAGASNNADSGWAAEAAREEEGRGRSARSSLSSASAEVEGREGRNEMLLRCIRIDLRGFGLERAGLTKRFSDLLVNNGIPLMYSATFSTANLLVQRDDIPKAKRLLQSCF